MEKGGDMNLGFIGMGIMGSRMAMNLLEAGNDLTISNRTREKAQGLLDKGAKWAESPAELASAADILFTMLSTPNAVREVAAGENGFLRAMAKGALWVNFSTVDPDFARQMADLAASYSVGYLDAPVAGTKDPAARAELVFLLGGDSNDVKKCQPYFDCMGKKTVHLGDAGMGSSMKMLFNLMLGCAMEAYSETLLLGEAFGFSKDDVASVLLDAPVTAAFLKTKHPLIAENNFEEHFPLCWMRKDLHLAADAAYKRGIALPALNSIKELYGLAEKQGFGRKDFAAIYALLAKDAPGEN
jgi:3-hydroxyisobutyrate dehydrogenase/glyoxylate/succinic semialdehyde reductase